MLVVADSGATKTDWAWYDETGELVIRQTGGLNPTYTQTAPREELKSLPFDSEKLELHFYGAGCRAADAVKRIQTMLLSVWPQAEVKIYDDLLGAARASCGKSPGIVCILGTGSNSGLYDGEQVVDRIPNLGVMLGDEGSGAHIGKALLRAFFYREMPEHLRKLFEAALPGGRDEFIQQLYGQQSAGAYLASFVKLIATEKDDPWLNDLLASCFEEFIARHVMKYRGASNLAVHFCGSIAWHFEAQLSEVLRRHGLRKGKILRKPVGELFFFHLNDASSQPFTTDRKNN